MEKKVLSGAIASAVALVVADPASAGNPREGLSNPPDILECSFDEFGYMAHWVDERVDEGNKYGGDLEVDYFYGFFCEANEESFGGDGTGTVELDLSTDAEDAFTYECEYVEDAFGDGDGAALCWASVDWESVGEAIYEDAEPVLDEAFAACEAVDGEFFADVEAAPFDGGSVFSVKEMSPGKGKGPQNWAKAFEVCEFDEFD